MESSRTTSIADWARLPFSGLAEVPPEDRSSALLLFIFQFGSAGGYVTSRTVADSLFLSQIGPSKLPAMYMVAAGTVAFASILYGSFAQRHSLRQIVRWTLIGYAVVSIFLPTMMHQYPESLPLFASVYVLAQIRGALGTVQFTTLLNESFAHGHHASVLGVVAMGATAAGIILGGLVGWLGQRVATEDLMYVAVAMDLVAFLPLLLLRGSRSVPAGPGVQETDAEPSALRSEDVKSVFRAQSFFFIAGLACLVVLVSTLVEFQWKVAAAEELTRDKARLTTYFGYFYAVLFLLIGITQLVFTGRVLGRLGVLPALMALPFALAISGICTLLASAQRVLLWAITLAKGCDVLRRGLNDPGMQMLYTPMPKHERRRAIAIVFGIVKPSTEALAALVLLALVPLIRLREISYFTTVLATLWLALVVWRWMRYSKTTSES